MNAYKGGKEEIGLFSLNPAGTNIPVEKGTYLDLISDKEVVSDGTVFVTYPRLLSRKD